MDDKKVEMIEKILLLIVIVVLFVVAFGYVIKNYLDKQDASTIEVKTFESINKSTGVVSLYVDELSDAKEYSFDGGTTWQKSNYGAVYQNGGVEVLVKNETGEIIARGKTNVSSIEDNAPIVKIDYNASVDENSLMNGVTASDNGTNITDKVTYEIIEKNDNSIIVLYTVTSNDKMSYIARKVTTNIQSSEQVYALKMDFDKTSYSCSSGETIHTHINGETPNSFTSSNNSIATAQLDPENAVKCANCTAVKIDCIKEGNVEITVKGEHLEAKASVTVNSDYKVPPLSFNETNYSCDVGGVIHTYVKGETPKSFTSTDSSIITAELDSENAVKCANCTAVKINCHKAGNASVTVIGASTRATASVEVKGYTLPPISFNNESYSCDAGEVIHTFVKGEAPKSFSTSDSFIATAQLDPENAVKCANCTAVRIDCHHMGNVEITAVGANSQATTKVNVNGI